MKRLLLALFLLCAHPAFAAVSTPVVSASDYDSACDVSAGFDVTITISSGTNNALFWYVFIGSDSPTISSVVWDPAGANQSLTSAGSIVRNTTDHTSIQAFYLANPTPGTSVVRVKPSSTVGCFSGGFVSTGVDQVNPVRAGSYTSDVDAKSITVTSQTDDLTTTMVLTGGDVSGTDKTIIAGSNNPYGGTGFDYAVPSGNVTHTWSGSFSGSPFASILGFSIAAGSAPPPSTTRRRAQVY